MAVTTNSTAIEGYIYFDNKKYMALSNNNIEELYLYNSINKGYFCFLKIKDIKQLIISSKELITNKADILFHQLGQDYQIIKDLKFKLVNIFTDYDNSKFLNKKIDEPESKVFNPSNSSVWVIGYSEAQVKLLSHRRINDDDWFESSKISDIVKKVIEDNSIKVGDLTTSKSLTCKYSFTVDFKTDYEILQNLRFLLEDNQGNVPYIYLFDNNTMDIKPANLSGKSNMTLKIDNREWVYDYQDRSKSVNQLDWLQGYIMNFDFRKNMEHYYTIFNMDTLEKEILIKTNDEDFVKYLGSNLSNNFDDYEYKYALSSNAFKLSDNEVKDTVLKNVIVNKLLNNQNFVVQLGGNLFIKPDSIIYLDLQFDIKKVIY